LAGVVVYAPGSKKLFSERVQRMSDKNAFIKNKLIVYIKLKNFYKK
jgi:hypothetical protein